MAAPAMSSGVPMRPAFQRHTRSRVDLVLLCDMSSSVAGFSRFTIMLVQALAGAFRRGHGREEGVQGRLLLRGELQDGGHALCHVGAHLGRIRALAVMQAERSPQLPDVPTLKEATGIDNVSAPSWFAFMAPSGVLLPEMKQFVGTLKAREAEIIAISDDTETLALGRSGIPLPVGVPEWLSPLTAIVPCQLFAMHLAAVRDFDPDHPRGLRKVTETR